MPLQTYEVVLRVTATETDEDRFTRSDMKEALIARLDEFYPTDGMPIIPTVAFRAIDHEAVIPEDGRRCIVPTSQPDLANPRTWEYCNLLDEEHYEWES